MLHSWRITDRECPSHLKYESWSRATGGTLRFWNPVSGEFEGAMPRSVRVAHSRKTARGRAKVDLDAARAQAKAA